MTVSPRSFGATLKAYVALTKPRIIELLLITTVPAMVLAAGGWPGWGLVLGTVGGGALSAGGANAINNVVDRDIDARMGRTRRRPLPAHTASPREALVLGLVLGLAGYLVLWQTSNAAAAVLATSALGFYVLVYTLYLKRTTPQNIVIGGAAGAVPALVGWAAVTGQLDLAAWLLFAVIFYWTPPHFWALALRFRADYEAAGVPMLPVVVGERATTVQILVYSVVVVGVSLLLQPASGLGLVYLSAAIVLGVALIVSGVIVMRNVASAIAVFRFSNIYLALLFAAVALDVLVGSPMEPSLGLAVVGGLLVVGGSALVVLITKPATIREMAFVLVPAVAAAVLGASVIGAV